MWQPRVPRMHPREPALGSRRAGKGRNETCPGWDAAAMCRADAAAHRMQGAGLEMGLFQLRALMVGSEDPLPSHDELSCAAVPIPEPWYGIARLPWEWGQEMPYLGRAGRDALRGV